MGRLGRFLRCYKNERLVWTRRSIWRSPLRLKSEAFGAENGKWASRRNETLDFIIPFEAENQKWASRRDETLDFDGFWLPRVVLIWAPLGYALWLATYPRQQNESRSTGAFLQVGLAGFAKRLQLHNLDHFRYGQHPIKIKYFDL